MQDIAAGGDKTVFARTGHDKLKGWAYPDMWWHTGNTHNGFAARGVHGQTVYIDPKAQVVIVRSASHPIAGNSANDATLFPAYQALAEYLIKKDTAL